VALAKEGKQSVLDVAAQTAGRRRRLAERNRAMGRWAQLATVGPKQTPGDSSTDHRGAAGPRSEVNPR